MNARDFLSILNCLKNLINLDEYKIVTVSTYNENNSGFCVNTYKKIIEITIIEEG